MRAAMGDLADGADRDRRGGAIENRRLGGDPGPPGRSRVGILLVGPERRGQGSHFGLAVEVPQSQMWQSVADLAEDLVGHRGGAVVALPKAGQVDVVEDGAAQQADPHRWWSE